MLPKIANKLTRHHTPYDLRAANFLVIDDNPHMRLLVRQLLYAFGVRNIKEADDGAHALKILKVFHPDIVICDWYMSPLDGVEFTRFIRTSSDIYNPYLPIIMLTGYTELHLVEQARDAGIDEFLSKPISAHMLYDRILSIIEKRRPFIKTATYHGPDRRRHHDGTPYNGIERRLNSVTPTHEPMVANNLFGSVALSAQSHTNR